MKKVFFFLATTVSLSMLFSFVNFVEWVEYSSTEGNYKIMMPAHPQEQNQKVPSALGELTMYIAMLESDESDDNLLYMSAFSEYPIDKIHSDMGKESIDLFFKGAAEGGAKNMNGKIKTMTESKFKQYPARDIVTEASAGGQNFLALQKLILVKNRFYMLQTLTKSGKDQNANAKKFFESFQLN